MDLIFVICVCIRHAVYLVVTCWERSDLMALFYVMFSCDFITFPYGVLGQVWYLIVSIPDRCILSSFILNVIDRKHITQIQNY